MGVRLVFVLSVLLVIVGAVMLALGVFNVGDQPLTFVYISIASCLLAAVALGIGVLRARPRRQPVQAPRGDGAEATWSGASPAPAAAEQEPPAGARPHVQVVTAEDATPPAEARAAPEARAAAPADQPGADEMALFRPAEVVSGGEAAEDAAAGRERTGTTQPTARKSTAKRVTAAGVGAGEDAALFEEALSGISGVGPAKRSHLIRHFGSFDRLRSASVEELQEVPGISETLARRIHSSVRQP
jgi:hypothetical protein